MKKTNIFKRKISKKLMFCAISLLFTTVIIAQKKKPTYGLEIRDNDDNVSIGPNDLLTKNDESTAEPFMSWIIDDNDNEDPGGFSWWADGSGGVGANVISAKKSDSPFHSDLLMFLDHKERNLLMRYGGFKSQGRGLEDWGQLKLIADYDDTGDGAILFGNSGDFGNFTELMRMTDSGRFGVGTTSPTHKVHVIGDILVENGAVKTYLGSNKLETKGWIGTMSNHGLYLGTNNNGNIYLDTSNNVYIGDVKSSNVNAKFKIKYNLFVDDGILTEHIALAGTSSWADYVFSDKYQLKPLEEVENYIQKNGHLPNIDSQEKIKKEGYDMHEMNVKFLEKIEELMLYTIQQGKLIKELKEKVESLEDFLNKEVALTQGVVDYTKTGNQ